MSRQDHDDLRGHGPRSPDLLVCITGGRDRHQTAEDAWWIRAWLIALGATVFGHGDCYHRCSVEHCPRRSIDRYGGDVAARLGLQVRAFPARWDLHGNAAGTLRNLEMLGAGPIGVLALPGARGLKHDGRPTGTGHMVFHARSRGIPVYLRGMDDPPTVA
jgi:hypothetical protein